MKTTRLFLVMMMAAVLSCTGNRKVDNEKETVDSTADSVVSVLPETASSGSVAWLCTKSEYKKKDKYSEVEIEVEWPDGKDEAMKAVRNDLWKVIANSLRLEGKEKINDLSKNSTVSLQELIVNSGITVQKRLSAESAEMHKERVMSMKEYAAEEGQPFVMPEIMPFILTLEIEKETETENYCVFDAELYTYTGGAHGMTVNVGGLTYNKKNGRRFTAFLKPSVVKNMQPLLRKGLKEYFSKEGGKVTDADLDNILQIEGTLIPLPSEVPHPSPKGLVFRYGSYEIASYASGRPKFCISYNDIKPYLTEEAKELLGL